MTKNTRFAQFWALLTVLAAAFWPMLAGVGVVSFSADQIVIVTGFTSATLAAIFSLVAHYKPETSEEPAAVSVSVLAWVNSGVVTLVGFQIVSWDATQQGLVLTFANAVVGLLAWWFVWERVTPMATVKDAAAMAKYDPHAGENPFNQK